MNPIDIKKELSDLIQRYVAQKNEVSHSMSECNRKIGVEDLTQDDKENYWVDFGTYNTLDCVLTALNKLYERI